MGYGLLVFLVYVLLLGAGKYLLFRQKASQIFTVNWTWTGIISLPKKASASKSCFVSSLSLLRSTGVSNSVKRRAYLDFILKTVQKAPGKIWQNLYLRSYLRNGDLFALSLRLLLLSLLAVIFIEQAWIATAVVVLFNYLLLFQLLALYHAFDYQYLTQLFPLEKGEKEKGLKQIVLGVGSAVLLLELLVGAVVFQEKIALLALVGASLFLQLFYLPYQLKRLVDE